MSKNYSPALSLGQHGEIKQNYPPPKVALQSDNKENGSASSILLLTHDTTEIHIAPSGQHVVGKWISDAVLSSSVAASSVISGAALGPNFDFMVANGEVGKFVVPISTSNQNYGSVMGVNRREGLYPAVALKTFVGTGSILTVQF